MVLKLTGPQKVAFFIMSLDPKSSKELMGKLETHEKDIIRRTMMQIKKSSLPIFLKMWETFKHDIEHSHNCETSWPDITKSSAQNPAPLLKSTK